MQDGLLESLKIRAISLPTQESSQAGFSTHATWVPRTLVLRPEGGRNSWLRLSAGKLSDFSATQDSKYCTLTSYHTDLNMDSVVTAVRNLFTLVTGAKPQFRAHGGSQAENLAMQNIQVRWCATIGNS